MACQRHVSKILLRTPKQAQNKKKSNKDNKGYNLASSTDTFTSSTSRKVSSKYEKRHLA